MNIPWPKELELHVHGPHPRKSYVVVLYIRGTKNNFLIGIFQCNSQGVLRISKDSVRHSIESLWSDYPMDYSGFSNGNCLEAVLAIESRDSLEKRARRVEGFFPDEGARIRNFINEYSVLIEKEEVVTRTVDLDTKVVEVYLE